MGEAGTAKLKIKIGDHEFEAEGPAELVMSQFEAFKTIITTTTTSAANTGATNGDNNVRQTSDTKDVNEKPSDLSKVLHVSGRVVSLTALPASPLSAALLVMLGHKELRNNIAVTGQEIGDGLDQSGKPVLRVDRIMEKALEEALVLKTGIKRGTRYRLTNQGVLKAQAIAKELLDTLP